MSNTCSCTHSAGTTDAQIVAVMQHPLYARAATNIGITGSITVQHHMDTDRVAVTHNNTGVRALVPLARLRGLGDGALVDALHRVLTDLHSATCGLVGVAR